MKKYDGHIYTYITNKMYDPWDYRNLLCYLSRPQRAALLCAQLLAGRNHVLCICLPCPLPTLPRAPGQCRPQSRCSEMFAEVEKMTEFRRSGKYIRMMCQRKFDTKYFRARDSYGNYLIWKL